MTYSGLMTDYLGSGLAAARPVTPNVAAGVAPIYYETDAPGAFIWDGSAWQPVGGAGEAAKRATCWADEFLMYDVGNTPGTWQSSTNVTVARYATYSSQAVDANGDYVTCSLILKAGTYNMHALGVTTSGSGIIDWTLDGVSVVAGQDWYAGSFIVHQVDSAGITVVGDGYHVLRGTINGKNGSSSGFLFSLTKIWFNPSSD